jgi:hypothetical protein
MIMKEHIDIIEKSKEKFVEKSKDIIHTFKVEFKKFISTMPNTITYTEDLEKLIGLIKLKEDLYSEEIYLKYKLKEKIMAFGTALGKEDERMVSSTGKLKDGLENLRKNFKKDVNQSLQATLDLISKNEAKGDDVEVNELAEEV